MAKQEYAKRILIDEIYSRFGSSVKLKERYKISSGTLDLAIMLEHQGKIIGIEIKNGSSEQTYLKMLHEIERYLIHTYLLLVIRVHTKSVHAFVRDVDSLIQRIEWITRKANLLTSEELSGHGCQWCVDQGFPGSTANIDTSFYSKTLEVAKTPVLFPIPFCPDSKLVFHIYDSFPPSVSGTTVVSISQYVCRYFSGYCSKLAYHS